MSGVDPTSSDAYNTTTDYNSDNIRYLPTSDDNTSDTNKPIRPSYTQHTHYVTDSDTLQQQFRDVHSTQHTTQHVSTQSTASTQALRPYLHCTMSDINNILDILNTLVIQQYNKQQCHVVITLLEAGLKVTVMKAQSLCIKLYIKKDTFDVYELREVGRGGKYYIDLLVLIKCLQIFGRESQTHVDLKFYDSDSPIQLAMSEHGTVSTCTIPTLTLPTDDSISDQFDFKDSIQVGTVDIESKHIRHIFNELDISQPLITVAFNKHKPRLQFAAVGNGMEVVIEFPNPGESKDIADLFTNFDCQKDVKHTYSMSLIKPCGRAIAKAQTTKIRVNESGMLSLQHSIPVVLKQQLPTAVPLVNWVEFLVLSSVENETEVTI